MTIQTTSRSTWTVPSQSQPGVLHLVKRVTGVYSCTCEADFYRGCCRHVDAVKAALPAPASKGPSAAETAALFMAPRRPRA